MGLREKMPVKGWCLCRLLSEHGNLGLVFPPAWLSDCWDRLIPMSIINYPSAPQNSVLSPNPALTEALAVPWPGAVCFPPGQGAEGELLCGFNYQEMVRDKFLCSLHLRAPTSSFLRCPALTGSVFSAAQPQHGQFCTGVRPTAGTAEPSFCKKTCKKPSGCAAKQPKDCQAGQGEQQGGKSWLDGGKVH